MFRRLFLAILIASMCTVPAWAADDDDDDAEDAKPAGTKSATPATKAGTKSTAAKKSKGESNIVGKIAKKTAAVATGAAIGLPVAFVRITTEAIPEHAKSVPFMGESSNKALVWASRGLMIPTAVFSGFVQAPYYSVTNAWNAVVNDDEPFSAQSFYIGDDVEGPVGTGN